LFDKVGTPLGNHELRPEHQSSARGWRANSPRHESAPNPTASRAARVHLVLPEAAACSPARTPEPSGPRSWWRGARFRFEPQQDPRPIRHVVASAVNGLKAATGLESSTKPGNCSPMAPTTDTDSAGPATERPRRLRETEMRNQIEAIVSSVGGIGARARVQLSADFDYNKITQTSDKFDPEGRRAALEPRTREEILPPPSTNNGQVNRQQRVCRATRNRGRRIDSTRPEQRRAKRPTTTRSRATNQVTEVTEAGRVNRISGRRGWSTASYSKNEKGEMVPTRTAGKEQLDRIAAPGGARAPSVSDQKARRSGRGREPAAFAEAPVCVCRRSPNPPACLGMPAIHQGRRDVRPSSSPS